MKIDIEAGRYVVAVSGGVDSMVLLDLLRQQPDLQLIVVHLDHGIRPDSSEDRKLVAVTAQQYGLQFEYMEAKLGPETSEADARMVRYDFLKKVQKKYQGRAIITAHHQDDLLETALLNMLRGTGRKGLSSLASSKDVLRPLLHVAKADIRSYALTHDIKWREDSTNEDERYLRNFVRRQLIPKLSDAQKQKLLKQLAVTAEINTTLDGLLDALLEAHRSENGLDRRWFVQLPYDVSTEVMATWLRSQDIREFDRKGISRLVVAAKTSAPGKRVDIIAGAMLHIGKHYLQIARRDPS
jgi:tRNA(Ile)-lysidine synthase